MFISHSIVLITFFLVLAHRDIASKIQLSFMSRLTLGRTNQLIPLMWYKITSEFWLILQGYVQSPCSDPPPPLFFIRKRIARSSKCERESRGARIVGSEGTRRTALGLSWHYMRVKPCLDNSQIHRLQIIELLKVVFYLRKVMFGCKRHSF